MNDRAAEGLILNVLNDERVCDTEPVEDTAWVVEGVEDRVCETEPVGERVCETEPAGDMLWDGLLLKVLEGERV